MLKNTGPILHRRLGRLPVLSSSSFSTNNSSNNTKEKQVFDKAIFEVGEWDPETRTNPLFRPKYTGTPRIVSADDFARRPSVGFTAEFNSLEDGMVTLSWLDEAQQKKIYDLYVSLLLASEKNQIKTSHEYAVRKIASQVRLTEERVAAVIQLQHNEQQMKREGVPLLESLSQYMDQAFKKEIEAAYSMQRGNSYTTRKPHPTFVEDPVGVSGLKDTKRYVAIDDLVQFDETEEHKGEMERAKQILESYRYIEDQDDDTIDIKLEKQCKQLMEANLPDPDKDPIVVERRKKGKKLPKYRETRADGTKRPRWKYVCQAIDSRKEPFQMNYSKNTLVEEDGVLRPGKMADVYETTWKPVRNVKEFTYSGVKKAWLNRVNRNQVDGWGYAREKPAEEAKKEQEPTTKASEEAVVEKAGGQDDTAAETTAKEQEATKASGEEEATKASKAPEEGSTKESTSGGSDTTEPKK